MTGPDERPIGVLLAAGRGRRLGGTKQLLEWPPGAVGTTLVAAAFDAIAAACARMVVVLGHEHMHMAGMLTPDQLADLEAATGPEFDRLFLTYMIQHHEGAVTMVHELFATDGGGIEGAVFKLASDIQADQTSEITRMRSMLESMN